MPKPPLLAGIEYPTLSFVGSGDFMRLVVDHETAHQWFYALVGNDQARDPWLDETLATWAQTRLGSGEPRSPMLGGTTRPAPSCWPSSERTQGDGMRGPGC